MGKSRLAWEAADSVPSAEVVRVTATDAASRIPFGAFAHLMPSDGESASSAIASYVDGLRNSEHSVVLVVEDGHLLDPASATLVLAVVTSSVARVLVTLRKLEPVPDAVMALWKDGHLARLDLEPLSRPDTRALVAAQLGGEVDGYVYRHVYDLTAGNPLYVRELLIDARQVGTVVDQDGRWSWAGGRPTGSRLREIVEARAHRVSAEAREALELVSLGAPLRLDQLSRLAPAAAVSELERSGLIKVDHRSDHSIVECSHPLYAEVVSASIPISAARTHRHRLAAEMATEGVTSPTERLRLAVLKLEAGESDPELYLEASRHAVATQAGVPGTGWGSIDPELATRLADAAGTGFEAVLCGARARMAHSRFSEIEERLAPFESEAAKASSDTGASYVLTRVYALHWSSDQDTDPLGVLDCAAAWHHDNEWAAMIATARSWILFGRLLPAQALESMIEVSDLDLSPKTRLDALLVTGMALNRLGLADQCEAIGPEIETLVDDLEAESFETGWARYFVDGLVRPEAGRDLAATAARLRAGCERAEAGHDFALAAALRMALGRLELIRGHAADAISDLETGAEGLTSGDPRNGLGLALAYLARAYCLAGEEVAATAALDRAERLARERPDRLRLSTEVEAAKAWLEATQGTVSTGRDRLVALADSTIEDVVTRAEATHDALRLGADPRACAQRLRELAERSENELFGVMAEHATAIADRDSRGILAAARRFAHLGTDLLAAEAAAAAASAFQRDSASMEAREAASLAALELSRCGALTAPGLLRPEVAGQLSPRELEVAVLAAHGHSNRSIADELTLSVRTVETYVLRACQKLGVTSRTDLAELLSTTSPR